MKNKPLVPRGLITGVYPFNPAAITKKQMKELANINQKHIPPSATKPCLSCHCCNGQPIYVYFMEKR